MSSKPLSIFRTYLWGQAKQQPVWSVDSSTATGLLLCILLLSLGGWLYLSQASQIAATSDHMRETAIEIEKLERENALLRYQVAQLETISRIEARAKQLGLEPMYNQTTYLMVPESLMQPESVPFTVQAASDDLKPQVSADKAAPDFIVGSLAAFWNQVKDQIESWIGP